MPRPAVRTARGCRHAAHRVCTWQTTRVLSPRDSVRAALPLAPWVRTAARRPRGGPGGGCWGCAAAGVWPAALPPLAPSARHWSSIGRRSVLAPFWCLVRAARTGARGSRAARRRPTTAPVATGAPRCSRSRRGQWRTGANCFVSPWAHVGVTIVACVCFVSGSCCECARQPRTRQRWPLDEPSDFRDAALSSDGAAASARCGRVCTLLAGEDSYSEDDEVAQRARRRRRWQVRS